MAITLFQAYIIDQIDPLVIGLLLLSILNIWNHKTIRWINFFIVPLLITYGIYLILPSQYLHSQNWLWGILFFGWLLLTPQRLLPQPSKNQLSSLFLFLAVGIVLIRSIFWGYFLFNSAVKERQGSFRMEGVVWATQQANAWQFNGLHTLIKKHWYFPSDDQRYIYPYPDNAEQRLTEGIKQAEAFRRQLLEANNDEPSRMELLAAAIIDFQAESTPFLEGRPTLERFDLQQEELIQAVKGTFGTSDVASAFSSFKGHWYGRWGDTPVDHEWRHLYIYDPPKPYPEAGVIVTLTQYAWIGDGFGWNLYAKTTDKPNHSFILGAVYHVREKDPSQVYLFRPHVGIDFGIGKLIWITKGEVFFEETLPVYDKTPERYVITGFNYSVQENGIQIKKSFQTIYTRDPDDRPGFYEFYIH